MKRAYASGSGSARTKRAKCVNLLQFFSPSKKVTRECFLGMYIRSVKKNSRFARSGRFAPDNT